MSDNKELLDVIDEMLEKLDNEDLDIINKPNEEFDTELREKLDAVANKKGFSNYTSMLTSQVKQESDNGIDSVISKARKVKTAEDINNEFKFMLNYVKDAINGIEYDPRQQGLYKDGHQEALNKYYDLLGKTNNMNAVLDECSVEESSINRLDTLRDVKLKGYKDGLYLFGVIVEDANTEIYSKANR